MNLNSANCIKAKLVDFLFSREPNILIANELRYGSRDYRVDIVQINKSATAYEIKSNSDKILNFFQQYSFYSEVFDYVYLVTPVNQAKLINKKALKKAGLILVDDNGNLHIKYQAAKLNKKNKFEILNSIPINYLKKCFYNCNINSYEFRKLLMKKYDTKRIKSEYIKYLTLKLTYANKLLNKERGQYTHTEDLQILNIKQNSILRF